MGSLYASNIVQLMYVYVLSFYVQDIMLHLLIKMKLILLLWHNASLNTVAVYCY